MSSRYIFPCIFGLVFKFKKFKKPKNEKTIKEFNQGSNWRGPTAKRGAFWSFNETFFGAEGAEKWDLLKNFWEKLGLKPHFWSWRRRQFWEISFFSEKSHNCVKFDVFIAWLRIKWRKKSKKPLYISYFSKFVQWHIFQNPECSVTQPSLVSPSIRYLNLMLLVPSKFLKLKWVFTVFIQSPGNKCEQWASKSPGATFACIRVIKDYN